MNNALQYRCLFIHFMPNVVIEMVYTNNGLERQNESFKYSYLQWHKNSSIAGMLPILIEEFLLDKYERYLHFFVNFWEPFLWDKYSF